METYLTALARQVIQECTFEHDCGYLGQQQRMRVFLPSGDNKYSSFWVRDCSMTSLSGEMPLEDIRRYVMIIAHNGQNGSTPRYLANGLVVPPYAVADHINFDGYPVFYPGTYGDGDNQGDGRFGKLPPLDDNSFFVLMAAHYVLTSGDRDFLVTDINGMTLLSRLERAMEAYNVDPKTELFFATEDMRAVDWGFADAIVKTGTLLMPSLFRRNAALAMAELTAGEKAAGYRAIARRIDASILHTFWDGSGWLLSATDIGRQHDVWGTAYAAQAGVLTGQYKRRAQEALVQAYTSGDAIAHGYVRHIPVSENHSPHTAWERSSGPVALGDYQNGAYWSTPTGWYFAALYDNHKELALQLMQEFIEHTKTYEAQGAPYEHINKDTTRFSGSRYGTSAALPLAGWKQATY
ncbi:MAG: hypothetical protein GX810_01830 [Clostridiales bacterium]|nr:hypothetical protein [Clostridiales bacterium]